MVHPVGRLDGGTGHQQRSTEMHRVIKPTLIVAVALPAMAPRLLGVEVTAHRGASHDAPENTLASVNLAWQRNADAVEIDVFLSADGHIVAYHDKDTKRIGGRDKLVKEQTLAELQTLDVGAWKGKKWRGEKIPTLDQVLETIPVGKRLFIEIKCGDEIIPELSQVLKASGKQPEQAAIIGFSLETMKAAKQALPNRQVYWVVAPNEDEETGEWGPPAAELIQRAKKAGLDGLDLGMAPLIDQAYVAEVKQSGLQCYAWTINSAAEARKLERWGIDGITTDRPGWLRGQLRKRKVPVSVP